MHGSGGLELPPPQAAASHVQRDMRGKHAANGPSFCCNCLLITPMILSNHGPLSSKFSAPSNLHVGCLRVPSNLLRRSSVYFPDYSHSGLPPALA